MRLALGSLFEQNGWDAAMARMVSEAASVFQPPPDALVINMALADGEAEGLLRKLAEQGTAIQVVALDDRRSREARHPAWTGSLKSFFAVPNGIHFSLIYSVCSGTLRLESTVA